MADGSDEKDRWLTTGQLADYFGVDRSTIARWVRVGRLVPTQTTPSGHHRWKLSDVREQLAELRRQGRDAE